MSLHSKAAMTHERVKGVDDRLAFPHVAAAHRTRENRCRLHTGGAGKLPSLPLNGSTGFRNPLCNRLSQPVFPFGFINTVRHCQNRPALPNATRRGPGRRPPH